MLLQRVPSRIELTGAARFSVGGGGLVVSGAVDGIGGFMNTLGI